jgi:hypothetical protein
MKRLLKAIAPPGLRRAINRIRRRLEARRNAVQTVEAVFTKIYREGKWAPREASNPRFHSGSGSATASIVRPYIDAIASELQALPQKPRLVDLGCGDFAVGRQLVPHCAEYIGVDVVPELIAHLRTSVKESRVSFVCLDITSAVDLPDGDVCLIRQVLQHLSNAQIAKVIPKLGKYSRVYVTEHFPADSRAVVPNRDKVHGADIRLYDNSAVYLDEAPFFVPSARLRLIAETRCEDFGELYDGGFIRTYLFTPGFDTLNHGGGRQLPAT